MFNVTLSKRVFYYQFYPHNPMDESMRGPLRWRSNFSMGLAYSISHGLMRVADHGLILTEKSEEDYLQYHFYMGYGLSAVIWRVFCMVFMALITLVFVSLSKVRVLSFRLF